MKLLFLYSLMACTLLSVACINNTVGTDVRFSKGDTLPQPSKNSPSPSLAGTFSVQEKFHFDSTLLPAFLKKYPEYARFKNDLIKFYRPRGYSYAWYDSMGLIEQASNLYNRIQQLDDEGITRQLPYKKEFEVLMSNNDSSLRKDPMNAEAELLISSQYLAYANITWQGIDEKQTKNLDWFLPRKKLSLSTLMDSLFSDNGKALFDEEPVYYQYALLKEYLKRYRELEKSGTYPNIKTRKRSFRLGDSSTAIKDIRRSLFLTKDLSSPDTLSMVMDTTLEKAVKNFQLRHGWKDDGVVGAAVIHEMNIPVQDRIRQLLVNMERCRWVPVETKKNFLVINIPDYKLYVVENDSVIFTMKVVVGQTMHETAIFNGELKYIVFSPYWNIPPGIMKKEILPGIRKNSNYLKKHDMEWFGNGIRQKPGINNSLGLVKFVFPNSFNIYLHDTPSKNLFNEDQRAFSHGCIRLSEPKRLAEYLLRKEKEWDPISIHEAMYAGTEKYVPLRETVPVFIAYFTAWVDRAGQLQFRDDIYGRDKRLEELLFTN